MVECQWIYANFRYGIKSHSGSEVGGDQIKIKKKKNTDKHEPILNLFALLLLNVKVARDSLSALQSLQDLYFDGSIIQH